MIAHSSRVVNGRNLPCLFPFFFKMDNCHVLFIRSFLLPVSENQWWRWWVDDEDDGWKQQSGFPKEGCTKSGALAQLWLILLCLPVCCEYAFKDLIGQVFLDHEQFESWICNVLPHYLILPVPTSRPFYLSSEVTFTICGTVGKDEGREVLAALRLIFVDSLPALWPRCFCILWCIYLICFADYTSKTWLSPHSSVWFFPVYCFIYDWETRPYPGEYVHNHSLWMSYIYLFSLTS